MAKLYSLAAFLYWMALYVYVPTLPLYAQSKSGDLRLIGVALSMYGLGHIVIRLPVGIAASWLGRNRPLIIAGLLLVGLGALVMGATDSISELIVGRAITGIAAGTWVPLVLVFCGLFPVQEGMRATAILTFVGSLARVLASSVTGTLNNAGGYSLPFFVAAGAALLAVLVVLRAREEPRSSQGLSARQIGRVITLPNVLFPSLLSALAQHVDWAVTFGFLPIWAARLGATNVTQSMLLSLYFLTFILGNLVTSASVKRASGWLMACAGFVLLFLAVGVAALTLSLSLLFAAQLCIGLAQGVCHPVLMGMSIERVAVAERPAAMGLHQAVYAVGMFTGPWLSGVLADLIGIRSMFGVTVLVCLALSLPVCLRLARSE